MFPRARVQVSTRPRPPRIEVPSHSHLSPAPRSATIERSSQPLHSAVLRSPAATLETAGSARAMSTSASYSPSPTAKPPGRTHHQRTVSESGASPQFQVSRRAVLPPYSFGGACRSVADACGADGRCLPPAPHRVQPRGAEDAGQWYVVLRHCYLRLDTDRPLQVRRVRPNQLPAATTSRVSSDGQLTCLTRDISMFHISSRPRRTVPVLYSPPGFLP